MAAREQAPLAGRLLHRWEMPDGSLWAEFYRLAGEIRIRFPGLADFALPADAGPAICWPVPGLNDATRDHLYFNQVLPLATGRQGKLAFHGSAVAASAGAVAFLAASGRGKSTMAASWAAAGSPFLTDDGLFVVRQGPRYIVEPSHPSLRLLDDSRAALLPNGVEAAPPVSYTSKARLLAGGSLPYCETPRPLAAAFFLGDAAVDDIRIVQLRGAAILEAWVRHSFLLDIDDPAALGRHFEELAAFCHAVPSYALDYPRDYGKLSEVRAAILAQLEKNGDAA